MNEKKILVVDDEELIRKLLQRAFEKEGYTVRTANDAIEALDILKHESFQVMLLDLNLPGMSGFELCKRIRNDFPESSIFAITGYASLFELADCRKAGFDEYFTKPLDIEHLSRAIQHAFQGVARPSPVH